MKDWMKENFEASDLIVLCIIGVVILLILMKSQDVGTALGIVGGYAAKKAVSEKQEDRVEKKEKELEVLIEKHKKEVAELEQKNIDLAERIDSDNAKYGGGIRVEG